MLLRAATPATYCVSGEKAKSKKQRKTSETDVSEVFLVAGKTFGKPKADLNLHEIAFVRT